MAESQPFREATVLVLGAGASNPYGFPLGIELKQFLAGNQNEIVLNALKALGHDDAVIEDFRETLRYSVHPTIDILLERKRNFRAIGAYFIAGAISGFEKHDRLFHQQGWYAELFRQLDLETLDGELPNVSLVTLNYDRSLEHFLNKNIDYNCSHDLVDRCHQRRQAIKIVHAHGSIGEYPDVPYGRATYDAQSLHKAAEKIRIVSDRLDESPDFQAAQALLAKAKHIVFLGIGYNDRTLRALLSGVDMERTHFYGTALGLNESTKQFVVEFFSNRIILWDEVQNCGVFLRDVVLKQGGWLE